MSKGSMRKLNSLTPIFYAEGGEEIESDGYRYHIFTSTDTLTCYNGFGAVEFYIIGGGGGGGLGWNLGTELENGAGGGGGGCGEIRGEVFRISGSCTMEIGSGGVGEYNPGTGYHTDGEDSRVIVGGSVIAVAHGGGYGGNAILTSGEGEDGSNRIYGGGGGGGGSSFYGGGAGGTGNYAGGSGAASGNGGGGGGGFGSVGITGDSGGLGIQGSGGDGWHISWLDGYDVCGGGCGNGENKTNSYGGGSSGIYGVDGGDGIDNTGGGGGGSSNYLSHTDVHAGNGGSGFIILRYPIEIPI